MLQPTLPLSQHERSAGRRRLALKQLGPSVIETCLKKSAIAQGLTSSRDSSCLVAWPRLSQHFRTGGLPHGPTRCSRAIIHQYEDKILPRAGRTHAGREGGGGQTWSQQPCITSPSKSFKAFFIGMCSSASSSVIERNTNLILIAKLYKFPGVVRVTWATVHVTQPPRGRRVLRSMSSCRSLLVSRACMRPRTCSLHVTHTRSSSTLVTYLYPAATRA